MWTMATNGAVPRDVVEDSSEMQSRATLRTSRNASGSGLNLSSGRTDNPEIDGINEQTTKRMIKQIPS
jgi:hypothetical protein